LTREDLDDIFGRELVNDIEERSPFGILSVFLSWFALSEVDSYRLYFANSTAIKAAVRVGKMAHNAIEQRKQHKKREFESYEELEMREPIRGGTAMSVALFISQLQERLLKNDFMITGGFCTVPQPLRGTLNMLTMLTSLSKDVSSWKMSFWSASSMRNTSRGSLMTLTNPTWVCII
jgi:hypothetical protein